jgi:peptidylamidoglycolate lyase
MIYGCGVVVDGRDRICVTSRSQNPCVAIFDKKGTLLETWSNEFAATVGMDTGKVAATAHCIFWSKEGGEEYFYFTKMLNENTSPAADRRQH